jgi:hypothetical protein
MPFQVQGEQDHRISARRLSVSEPVIRAKQKNVDLARRHEDEGRRRFRILILVDGCLFHRPIARFCACICPKAQLRGYVRQKAISLDIVTGQIAKDAANEESDE